MNATPTITSDNKVAVGALNSRFYILDGSCTPACVGKECGADGCSGQCGPTCNDDNTCTSDSCDMSGLCDYDPLPMNGSPCDDELFCTITDTCSGGTCSGTANPCSDGVGCTNDTCNEVSDLCVNTEDDANCDDTIVCNGDEVCDAVLDCQPGSPPVEHACSSLKIWNGSIDDDWGDGTNWTPPGIPTSTDQVWVDPAAPNMPTLDTNRAVNAIYLPASTSLDMNSAQLTVGDVVELLGTVTGGGALVLDGTGTNPITTGGNTLASLTIAKPSGTAVLNDALTLTGALTISSGHLQFGSATHTIGGTFSLTGGSAEMQSSTTTVTGALTLTSGATLDLSTTGVSLEAASLDLCASCTLTFDYLGPYNLRPLQPHDAAVGLLIINGTITLSGTFNPGTATVELNGIAANLTPGTNNFYDLEINGTYTATADFDVLNDLVTAGSLTFGDNMTLAVGGDFDAGGSSVLTFGDNMTLTVSGVLDTAGTFIIGPGSTVSLGGSNAHTINNLWADGDTDGAGRIAFQRDGLGYIGLTLTGIVDILEADFDDLSASHGLHLAAEPGIHNGSFPPAQYSGFNYVTFRDGQPLGSLTYLTLSDPAMVGKTMYGLAFENTAATGEKTIANDTGGAVLLESFTSSSGYIWGPSTTTGDTVDWGVSLAEFLDITATGSRASNAVYVRFTTVSERNNLGFIVLRHATPGGPYLAASDLIPGAGTTPVGATYTFIDRLGDGEQTLAEAAPIYYSIQDIDFLGNVRVHGPVAVVWQDTVSQIDATPLTPDEVRKLRGSTGASPRSDTSVRATQKPRAPLTLRARSLSFPVTLAAPPATPPRAPIAPVNQAAPVKTTPAASLAPAQKPTPELSLRGRGTLRLTTQK